RRPLQDRQAVPHAEFELPQSLDASGFHRDGTHRPATPHQPLHPCSLRVRDAEPFSDHACEIGASVETTESHKPRLPRFSPGTEHLELRPLVLGAQPCTHTQRSLSLYGQRQPAHPRTRRHCTREHAREPLGLLLAPAGHGATFSFASADSAPALSSSGQSSTSKSLLSIHHRAVAISRAGTRTVSSNQSSSFWPLSTCSYSEPRTCTRILRAQATCLSLPASSSRPDRVS